jgi:superoxide reductase
MTALLQVYKCGICGNIVEVVHTGQGQLVCCGKPMEAMTENSVDASKEKHVPVAEKADGKLVVKVGSAPHPMEEKHYIEWIEVIAGGKVYRKSLKAGESPEAEFCIDADDAVIRAYCNIHGLWKK